MTKESEVIEEGTVWINSETHEWKVYRNGEWEPWENLKKNLDVWIDDGEGGHKKLGPAIDWSSRNMTTTSTPIELGSLEAAEAWFNKTLEIESNIELRNYEEIWQPKEAHPIQAHLAGQQHGAQAERERIKKVLFNIPGAPNYTSPDGPELVINLYKLKEALFGNEEKAE